MTEKVKKSWFKVVQECLTMYMNRDKYAYFYGAKGVKLTRDNMEYLWKTYPGHFKKYSQTEKEQIFKNSLGKTGYDCSGFVCKVTGETGYSAAIYDKRTKETTISNGVAGQFLYSTFGGTGRHIGIDIGEGFFMDMATESTDAAVKAHKDSIRLGWLPSYQWEHSFQTAAVNYNGSIANDPNT